MEIPFHQKLYRLIKPYWLPLALLVLVLARIVIFGDARIPVGKLFNELFHLESTAQGVKDHKP